MRGILKERTELVRTHSTMREQPRAPAPYNAISETVNCR